MTIYGAVDIGGSKIACGIVSDRGAGVGAGRLFQPSRSGGRTSKRTRSAEALLRLQRGPEPAARRNRGGLHRPG